MEKISKILFLTLGAAILIQGYTIAESTSRYFAGDSTRQNCNKNAADYETYTVKSIHISADFLIFPVRTNISDLLRMAQEKLKSRRENMLERGGPFTESGYFNLQVQINNDLRGLLFASSGGFVVIRPHIFNCDDQLKEVQVEYILFGVPLTAKPYLKGAFEVPKLYFNKRRAVISQVENPFQLVPVAGYNESRGLLAGVKLGRSFDDFKLVNKFDLMSDFSPSSFTVNTTLAGSQHFKSILSDYASWRIGYSYAKLPAAALTLTESTFSAQFFSATRPMRLGNTIFRYGTSIEGGRRATNLEENVLPFSNLKSSGYAATKFYLGGTSNWNGHSLKASYGLQLGNTGRDFQLNYLKNILDAAYRGRYLLADHKPLQVDVQLSSGRMKRIYGGVPATERFFGGNVEREFIQGDSWRIRSNPVIRSISQNRFNGSGSGGNPIGGDGFLSGNVTLSFPVWYKQLIPDEISQDPTLTTGLRGGVRSGRLVMTDSEAQKLHSDSLQDSEIFKAYKKSDIQSLVNLLYDSSSIDILQVVDSISLTIAPHLDFLNEKIRQTQDNNQADSVAIISRQLRLFTIVDGYCQSIKLFLPAMEDSADFDNDTQYDLEDMFLGYGKALPGYVPGLMDGIRSLKQFYKSTDLKKEWLTLNALSEKLRTVQNDFGTHFKKIETPVAERNARPNVDYVGKVLGVLFKELNILSVSPFAMLDAARLRIGNRDAGNGFQQGLGAGIRLSLINFDIYAGYSLNLTRQANDKKGAFVFTIDITDLF